MLDAPRRVPLTWAALCLLALAALAWAVTGDRSWLAPLDDLGRDAQQWAASIHWLESVLRVVEVALGTTAMWIYALVLVGVSLLRGHPRAAVFSVLVLASTPLINSSLKALLGRERPEWQNLLHFHSTMSFPSGHASQTTALAGVLSVLAALYLRRTNLRRLVHAVAVLLVLLAGADRVLLGRHYPSDVLGGVLLGAAICLIGVAIHNPTPRGHAESVEPLPEVYGAKRRLAVVLNPIKVEDVGQFRSVVETMAQESGWLEPSWHLTTIEDPGTGMAERAAIAGADLVMVCGGDGTVREVCAELAGTGIPVGIIPAGTGNLLARNLDIPLYLRSAIDVALNGQDRAIDLVDVSGDGISDTHFMVMAGMGFDAALMEGVNEDIKKKIGWFAYILSGLKSLMFPAVRIEVQIDDEEPTVHRARTVVVGNVGYLQAGMPLLPDAVIDDGVLDVVILHPKKFLSWVPLALRVLARSSSVDELIDRRTGQRVVLRAAHDTPRQLDGDSIGAGRELRMECVHGRLLVRVPR